MHAEGSLWTQQGQQDLQLGAQHWHAWKPSSSRMPEMTTPWFCLANHVTHPGTGIQESAAALPVTLHIMRAVDAFTDNLSTVHRHAPLRKDIVVARHVTPPDTGLTSKLFFGNTLCTCIMPLHKSYCLSQTRPLVSPCDTASTQILRRSLTQT